MVIATRRLHIHGILHPYTRHARFRTTLKVTGLLASNTSLVEEINLKIEETKRILYDRDLKKWIIGIYLSNTGEVQAIAVNVYERLLVKDLHKEIPYLLEILDKAAYGLKGYKGKRVHFEIYKSDAPRASIEGIRFSSGHS